MNHPMKRNRHQLKLRAARWAASKADTYEAAVLKRMYGYDIMRGQGKLEPKGILSS